MSKLADFIAKLASDPEALQSFEADPTGFMTEEGLSDEQQQILTSGDADAIRGKICIDEQEVLKIITTAGQKEIIIHIRDVPHD